MKTTFRSRLLGSTLLVGAAVAALPALAQGVPAQSQPADQPAATATGNIQPEGTTDQTPVVGQDIVVTGTLIRNPNLNSSSPVTTIGSDEVELRQSNTAEQLLRELPGAVPSIGSAVNNGNGGASYADLRGLGSNRNIVLLDGVRITPSDLVGRVDLNNIPLALVDRLDTLTGAAVTTYGADAITGVINFVTKKDFSGAEIAVSNQITEQGDGSVFRVDATVGANFGDGRGNAAMSIGYQQADPVFQGDRDFSIVQIDSYSGLGGGSGTAIPSRFTGTRPIDPATGLPSTNPATANGGQRQIDPVTGRAIANYSAFNFNPFNVFQTPFERFNIFATANYQVSDDIELYTRGLFSKNTVETIIAPSGSFGSTVTINLNNPYLPTALRNQFCAFNVAPVNPATGTQTTYTPRFTPAECTAAAAASGPGDAAYRTVTTALSRRTTELGARVSSYETTVFDYQLGVRGALSESFNYDLFGSYGESQNIQTIQGYALTSRVRQSLLVNGTLANPVCQNTAGGCVPTNWFGAEGSITPAAAQFLTANSTSTNRTSLAQVRGTISGDFGVASPGASDPIGVAVGGEYRKYRAQQNSDLLAQTAGELGGAGGAAPNIDGGFEVYEAFGELIAPLLQDKPFFESLTLEAGIRYSGYKVDAAGSPTNNTTTWKVGGSWEPGYGFKVRGNYNRAVRAPNINELFSPLNTVLTNLAVDPCAGAAPTTNANLRAVCLAQGAPAGTIGSIQNPTSAQANITAGGNLNIRPEKANTFTAGVVFQPDFFRGFTISADYYNIKITDVIGAPLPGDLIAACFGSITAGSATNPACTQIQRNSVTGGLDGDPSISPGLFAPLGNLGQLLTDGVDVSASYQTDLGFGKLALGFNGNWTNRSKYKATDTSLYRECVGYYSVNCSFTGSIQPEFQFSQRSTLSIGDVDLSLLWRYVGKVEFEPQQLADDIAAAVGAGTDPVTGCPDPTGTDPNGCVVNPEFRRIGAEHYFDLTARFNASDNLSFTITAINMLDNQPKVIGNTIGSTTFNSGNVYPSTYDALGRRFAVGAKLRF